MTMTPLLIALVVGLLAGTHAATWGMFKDALHEGFTWGTYVRSIVVGAFAAVALRLLFDIPLESPGALFVFFGLVYGTERGLVETWKTFFRDEDQSKYTIPMQLAIGGRVVRGRATRWAAGAGYALAVALLLTLVHRVDAAPGTPSYLTLLAVGTIYGWIAAVGGAWKDAPIEGFEPLKFFRSPLVTLVWAALLAAFTDRALFVAVAALGYERASLETYKTFFFPSKPRGKFSGKPVLFPDMLRRRRYFVPAYAAIWAVVLVTGVLALRAPSRRAVQLDVLAPPSHTVARP